MTTPKEKILHLATHIANLPDGRYLILDYAKEAERFAPYDREAAALLGRLAETHKEELALYNQLKAHLKVRTGG